ncbi:AMP-binding protein [Actinomadura rupiterrae]|uniref:AMP-binding protein n=1 Tax=Actinomadura rupiterrae TaxID=559627 RepID=UPI0020A595D2|nr:AMP-binding protein [Actinomadura rupiterrae]MCP2336017.1 acyl-CoA synthetase (AMP-forming)/AMP-acid ligase II [Actinomadura rupiterrae]
MTHARPAYRPGLRRRLGHARDLTGLLLRTGLVAGPPNRVLSQIGALRTWGTTLAGLLVAAAARVPDGLAIEDDEGPLTFAELDEWSARLAEGLPIAGPRPRVGLLCRNHRGLVLSLVACSRRGAEVVPLNTGFGPGQLRAVLSELRMDLIISDAEFAPLLSALPVALRRRVIWSDHAPADPLRGNTLPPGVEPLSAPVPADVAAPAYAPPPPPRPAGGLATTPAATIGRIISATACRPAGPPQVQSRTIMLSSGTMGRPRGARRPPRPGLWPLASMASRIPLRSRQTMVVEAPLFHVWGYAGLQMAWALHAPVVLHRRFDPERTLAALAGHRDVVLFAVPVMLQRILDLDARTRARYDTSTLRIVAVSGSALPGDLAVRFMDAFGDRLYNVYGSTETSWVSIATPRDLRLDPRTAGRPPAGTTLSILDPDGRNVPRGEIGLIHAANELMFEGYTGGEPLPVHDGLLATGDLGSIDRRGLLFVAGRADGVIVSGGENIVPRDVEDALLRMPEIHEVAVVGVPDPEWGQRVAAHIVPRPGARIDPAAVRAHVHTEVARYAVPRDVHVVPDLPRNATGKVVPGRLAPPPGRPA